MTTRRQICSAPDHFSVYDFSKDPFTYYCREECPGHNVRALSCDAESIIKQVQESLKANDEDIAVQHAAEDREIETLDAADTADDEYLDRLDTLGGASPDERRAYGPEREDRE